MPINLEFNAEQNFLSDYSLSLPLKTQKAAFTAQNPLTLSLFLAREV